MPQDRCSKPVQNGHLTESFPRVLQLNEDLYLTASELFLENYCPNRVFRFKIANFFYIFIYYTLAGTAEDAVKLSLSLFSINETISGRDYIADAAAIDYESVEDRNLNAILATPATANLNNQRFQTFIDSQSNFTPTTSADFQPSDVSHLLHNSFLMLLLSISSPFFNGILSLLTILALICGLVLTIMTFVGLYKRLKPKVKPRWSHFRARFTKARKPTVSGEVIEEQNMNAEV